MSSLLTNWTFSDDWIGDPDSVFRLGFAVGVPGRLVDRFVARFLRLQRREISPTKHMTANLADWWMWKMDEAIMRDLKEYGK